MADLRFEKINIPGANLGPVSAYPILYKQKMFEKESVLSDEEGLYINYGNMTHVLPYQSFDTYDRALDQQSFDGAVLENRYLKAVFIPPLGGRLWSLYDKEHKRDLVVNNPVFRPCNFAVRGAWVSGGIEWNCGIRGHSALTCDRIFAAKTSLSGGEPVLRMYAFERIRGVTFQMDFFLIDDAPFLFSRMRIVNGAKKVTPIYWWSTLAVEQKQGARVIVPADEAYVNVAEEPVYKISIPIVNNVDLSYPTNHTIAMDHFYKIPESARKYQAYVDKDGSGTIHASTRRLGGRKLFVWGSSTGGKNWQKFLTGLDGYKQPYIEIQAGLAATQNESLPMPPNTAWEWLEAYGAVNFSPRAIHGGWKESRETVLRWLDEVLPESRMDQLLRETKPMALQAAKRVYDGYPWGTLDNELRMANGRKPISPHLDFGELGSEQQQWLYLLQNGSLPQPDISETPPSYMVQDEWFFRLQEAVEGPDAYNWYTWYHLGLGYFAHDMHREARNAFEKSLALQPSSWGYHALANTVRVLGNTRQSALLMAKARTLNPNDAALSKEALRFAYEAGQYSLMLSILEQMTKEVAGQPGIQMYLAFALAHTGKLQEAKNILTQGGGLVFPDQREGDDSLVNEYIFIEKQMAAQQGKSLKCEDIQVPELIDFRMFHPSK
jgi:tetratricopeptide (TPR) repeat protein